MLVFASLSAANMQIGEYKHETRVKLLAMVIPRRGTVAAYSTLSYLFYSILVLSYLVLCYILPYYSLLHRSILSYLICSCNFILVCMKLYILCNAVVFSSLYSIMFLCVMLHHLSCFNIF